MAQPGIVVTNTLVLTELRLATPTLSCCQSRSVVFSTSARAFAVNVVVRIGKMTLRLYVCMLSLYVYSLVLIEI